MGVTAVAWPEGLMAVAQINPTVGDLSGNAARIIAAAQAAYAQGARLVITPELGICGYPPEDLLLRPSFVQACEAAVREVAKALKDYPDLHLVVGHPKKAIDGRACTNHASVLREGVVLADYAKRELPNYQVFDERRYFCPGDAPCVFELAVAEAGAKDDHRSPLKVGLLICEDAWWPTPPQSTQAAGADVLVVINASPFYVGKPHERLEAMRACALRTGLPLIYAHAVGGQDELVFDGHSFALDATGALLGCAKAFAEDDWIVPTTRPRALPDDDGAGSELASLWQALVLGVRDYVQKNQFPGVLLGLSGGIDSALVLAIAVDALGAQRVRAVMMPSPYTADISWMDARELSRRLGVRYGEIAISPVFAAFQQALAPPFAGLATRDADTTEENLQARIRGTLLMALSNKWGSLVLTTGNKSEMATGYCTLYGDMAGGFAVIKDVLKTTVFALARWRNAHDLFGSGSHPIPERIITRPPSAELAPNQTDQDSLPAYEVLDGIVAGYVHRNESMADLVAAGFSEQDVQRVVGLIQRNEYKRRQSPIGVRVTPRGFGRDWRYPLSNRYR